MPAGKPFSVAVGGGGEFVHGKVRSDFSWLLLLFELSLLLLISLGLLLTNIRYYKDN